MLGVFYAYLQYMHIELYIVMHYNLVSTTKRHTSSSMKGCGSDHLNAVKHKNIV